MTGNEQDAEDVVQETLLRAVASLKAQTHAAWQAVLVSDDGFDYAAFLAGLGFSDPRLVFTSTGRTGSGCHQARNAGLPLITGEALSWHQRFIETESMLP